MKIIGHFASQNLSHYQGLNPLYLFAISQCLFKATNKARGKVAKQLECLTPLPLYSIIRGFRFSGTYLHRCVQSSPVKEVILQKAGTIVCDKDIDLLSRLYDAITSEAVQVGGIPVTNIQYNPNGQNQITATLNIIFVLLG